MHGFTKNSLQELQEEFLKSPQKIKDYMKNMDFATFKAVVPKVGLKHYQRVRDFQVLLEWWEKLSGPNKQPASLYTFIIMCMIKKNTLLNNSALGGCNFFKYS